MKHPTTDELIEIALKEELDREPSLIAESLRVFAGRRGWWHAAAALVVFVAFAIAVFSAVQFFAAQTTDAKLLWATLFLAGLVFTLALKIYFWLQMTRNAVLRELKRIELRLPEND